MKKVLAIAALGMITLASCKKDYTCGCTSASNPSFTVNEVYPDQKKKDAETLCDTRESQLKPVYTDVNCSIK